MTHRHACTQILAVDGAETCGKPIQDVAKMFVGDEGTTVTLRISCANTPPHDVCLVRKAFHHAQVL
jgi:C-terminal processing protease CtpA/Prc